MCILVTRDVENRKENAELRKALLHFAKGWTATDGMNDQEIIEWALSARSSACW